MDSKTGEEDYLVSKIDKLANEGGALGSSKLKSIGSLSDKSVSSAGSISSKDMIFRADKIDLKSLDAQLEKHLSRVWSRSTELQGNQRPKEVWEIDPLKLRIRYLVAQGTYGTVYRGFYDDQDVAGIMGADFKFGVLYLIE